MTADKSFLASSLAIVRIVVQIFQRGQMAPVTKNNYDNNFSLFFLNESTYLASVIESIALKSAHRLSWFDSWRGRWRNRSYWSPRLTWWYGKMTDGFCRLQHHGDILNGSSWPRNSHNFVASNWKLLLCWRFVLICRGWRKTLTATLRQHAYAILNENVVNITQFECNRC